jgi:rhodanese-related sulfurtransferase
MNKTLKRFLVLLTVLAMVFSMVACSPETEAPTEPETPVETETPVEPEAPSEDVLADAVNAYFAEMPDGIYKIKQDAFLDKVAEGEDMFILDIRQADAYAAGHVKGAVNAPWGPAIAENLKFIPQDKTVYVYCYSGQTAGQAVMTLNAAGINAISVNLGFNFGISKVDGYEAFLEMDANEFGADEYEVTPEIQDALTAYYAGLADVKGTTFGNYKISEASLREMMDNMDDSIYILSIRSEADYAEGHIAGAEQMAFGAGMQENFADLPMDKKIVVYCYTGQTAGQTTAGLRLLGYDAVSLNGGMGMSINAPIGWANKGFPVHVVEEAANDYFANLPEDINKINQTAFLEKVAAGEEMFVLDIRQADAYALGTSNS